MWLFGIIDLYITFTKLKVWHLLSFSPINCTLEHKEGADVWICCSVKQFNWFLKNSFVFHLLSNTSNSYLNRFNETCVSLNSSEKCAEILKKRKADIPGLFSFCSHWSPNLRVPTRLQLWLDVTSATAHTSQWDTCLPQIPSEEKMGITNLIRFWTCFPDKHMISQEDPVIRALCLT